MGGAYGPPLGPLLVLTDRTQCRRPLPDVVAAAVAGGARTVVLREKDLALRQRAALAERLRALVEPAGGRLVLAGPPLRPAGDVGGDDAGAGTSPPAAGDVAAGPLGRAAADVRIGDAVHLSAADDLPVPRPPLVGRSCHDLADVRRAAAEGCDWVTVSPVRTTASKPGYGPALGLDGLAATTGCGVPVYALGGLTADDVRACLAAGAAGVAVMGAVMRADRPDRVVADLLACLAPEPTAATGGVR